MKQNSEDSGELAHLQQLAKVIAVRIYKTKKKLKDKTSLKRLLHMHFEEIE